MGHMVWQPYWIEEKLLNNVFSGTTSSIDMKLQNYDLVVVPPTTSALGINLIFLWEKKVEKWLEVKWQWD